MDIKKYNRCEFYIYKKVMYYELRRKNVVNCIRIT